jgi:hypothetical protein
MTIFYCVECQNIEDRDSEEGWDCSRCGDPMTRFNEASEERSEIERLREALRYIAGYDVAGMEPHQRSEDVARAALGEDG